MSKYNKIDEIIYRWISRHGFHLLTKCKGEEVRSVRLTDERGRIYGIGIDPPRNNDISVRYYAWDFKKRNCEKVSDLATLETCLEEALLTIQKWMRE